MFWLPAVLLLNDSTVTGYVEHLCHRFAPQVQVAVIVDADAAAGVKPNGEIRITTAMITEAENEAELAGILAHEIAHLRKKIDAAPPDDEDFGICLRFNRHDLDFEGGKQWEHDADQTAIEMLTKAGYDPMAMLRYFSTLRHASPGLPRAFSAEDILIERLQLEANDHPMKDPVVDTPEFQAIRGRLK